MRIGGAVTEPYHTPEEWLAQVRELAYSNLDAALLLGVETTIQEMRDRNLSVHSSTLRAQAWLRDHGVTTEG